MGPGSMVFANRKEAGRFLASRLAQYANRQDVTVLGLPRGGVPVAYEIAVALQAPLDIFLCRKLGVPGQEELGLGAISSGGIRVLNEDVVEALGISARELDEIAAREEKELERRERVYRGGTAPLNLSGRIAILVDDGLATGSTMQAALLALRQLQPARIVVAVPVAPAATVASLQPFADEVICLTTPKNFHAISQFYEDFPQLTDKEVLDLLTRSREWLVRS